MSPEDRPVATICYLEIPAPDLAKARAFYADVFGWAISDSPIDGDEYAMFEAGELSGGLNPAKPVADGGVILYLSVPDIADALARIEKAGGTTTMTRTRVDPNSDQWGFIGQFRDPNGNPMGIWSKA